MSLIFRFLGLSGIQFWIGLALIVSASAGSGYAAWQIRSGIAARHELGAVTAALNEVNRQADITVKAVKDSDEITRFYGMQFAESQRTVQTRTQFLTREVTTYVPKEVDVALSIPVGFVRLYDAAASGTADPAALPIAAGQPNDAASDIKLSEVAAVSAANFGACHETAEQLIGLQGWVEKIKAWNDDVQRKLSGK